MKVYNTTKLTLVALATLLFSNIWAQVAADFTSNITTACSVPVTVDFTNLSASPGVGIESWAWNFGNGLTSTVANPSVSYTTPGNYTVSLIAIDSLGASDTITYTAYIDLSGAMYVTHANVNTSCNGCADGSITLNVSGGTPQYTYLWGTGNTTASLTGIEADVYNVTVTDNAGCSVAQSIYLDSLCIHYISSTITPSCAGGSNGAIDVVLQSGSATPYSYTWSNGATTQDLTGLTAGFYSLTITDGGSCSELYYFIVPSSAAVQVTIDVDQPISCNGASDGMLGSTVVGGAGGYSYYWKDPNYCYVCPPSPPAPAQPDSFPNAFAGMYILNVYDANGCGGVDTLILTEPDTIAVTATVVNNSCTACNDGELTVNATGGTPPFQYSINGAPLQFSNVFSNLSRGTYTVDVIDNNGCTGSAIGIVVDTACLHSTMVQTQMDVDCFGGATGSISVVTTGSVSPYNYVWSFGALGTSTVNNLPAGTYYLETTDAIGCTTLDTFLVNEPPQIVTNVVVNDVFCFGENQGSAQVFVSGGVLPVMYSWTSRPAFTGYDTIQDLAAGSYFVTVTDANGCEAVAPFTIGQPLAMNVSTIDFDASCPSCTDGSLTAVVSGGTPNYTYAWSTTPPQTGQTATFLAPGNYDVTIVDANGCTATTSATVNGTCNLSVDLGNDTAICFGVYNINPFVANAQGAVNYLWSTGETAPDILVGSTGDYKVTVTDISTGCIAIGTIQISDANPAATVSNDTTICLGGTASLLATGGISYDWTGGAVSNNNIANPTTSPTLTSLYFVEIDNGTCISVRYVQVSIDSNCVWPGDADNSGLTDNDDVLAIGIGYGDTGPTRSFASLVWEGQRGNSWTNSLLSGTNYKHIDTNGNGTIDDDDTLAISLNYGLSHPKRSEDERETTMPMIFVELPDSVSAGQTVQGALVLGTDSFPLSNMYGIKFTMNYNTDFIEENTVSFNFGPSWMGTPGNDLLTFQKDLYTNGRIDGAITGINHTNRGGYGNIGIVNFTMKDDISGKDLLALPMVLDFVNVRAIDANEGLVDVEGGATTVIATQEVTGIGSVKPTLPVAIYPNPAQNVLYINTYGEQLEGIQVSNMLGETFVLPTTHHAGVYSINTASISAGVYILTIQSQNHVAIERIVINK